MIKIILFYFSIWFGGTLIRILFQLNKRIIINKEIFEELISNEKSIIICCWHGRLLYPFFLFRNKGYNALAGLHRDAEIISKIGEKIGWKMIRGSSSKLGKKAYEEIIVILKKRGNVVAITPDGPKGPRLHAKKGVVRAARKTGAVIIPMSGQSSRKWEIKNWDAFVVPKPLGKTVMVFGEPMMVSLDDDIDLLNTKLEKRLILVQEEADAFINNKI